jgi:transcriptional regulator with XRE-family HTH domain
MPAKDERSSKGLLIGDRIVAAVLTELRNARLDANLSQAALAKKLGWTQTRYSRFERNADPITVEDVCLVAIVLGLKPRFDLYRVDEGLRDQGSVGLVNRFCALLSPVWLVMREAPFPNLGDFRSWDVLLRLGSSFRVGVEAETRLRELEGLVRRIRQRELHGDVNEILVVLSRSGHNRSNVDAFRTALGPSYLTPSGDLLAALRTGRQVPGSGVILL